MQKRKFTVVTQLHDKNNSQIIEYVENSRVTYAHAMRKTFQHIKHTNNFNKSAYNTYLQNQYSITKRTANSIISDAQGRLSALIELKRHEKQVLEHKIDYFETKVIPQLQKQRDDNCAMLRAGLFVNLTKHRNLKRKLVAKKNKLNRMKQKLSNLDYQLESGQVKICFGTKNLLNKDYAGFIEHRDNQMSFVGTKTETSGNQLLQLNYNKLNNQFNIKLRKDFGGFKTTQGNDKYAFGKVYFNHHKQEIISILEQKNSPLSYKIIKRYGRYYLYCTFEIQQEGTDIMTRSTHGVIGLDFNKGFVTLTETNAFGHMIQNQFLPYRFQQGYATKSDLQAIANDIVKLALTTGKDVTIEDLNFKRTKAKTESKYGKKYNEMIHSLAYRQFVETMESITYRNNVYLNKVNPAWTSWIAKNKYCPQMKLNTHVGASFVIARRGQGFRDKV